MSHSGALYDKFDYLTLWEGGRQLSEAEGTKTQRIAIKFGMLVIGLGANHRSTDELAQTKKIFFGTPYCRAGTGRSEYQRLAARSDLTD